MGRLLALVQEKGTGTDRKEGGGTEKKQGGDTWPTESTGAGAQNPVCYLMVLNRHLLATPTSASLWGQTRLAGGRGPLPGVWRQVARRSPGRWWV